MSYAIGQIIFGISPDYELAKEIAKNEIDELCGFTTYYSGSSSVTPMMVGVEIKAISETEDVDLSALLIEIEKDKFELVNEFKLLKDQLLMELETVAEDYNIDELIVNEIIEWVNNTKPSFKIVWRTS